MRKYKTLVLVLIAFVVGASCRCSTRQVADESSAPSFALLFTTSVHGWVEPCGCTSEPLGGIARLATSIKQEKKRAELGSIFIDGGDLLFESLKPMHPADQCQENARIDLLLSSLKDLGVVGTIPGPFDDVMGAEFRNERYLKHDIKDLTKEASEGLLSGSPQFRVGVLYFDDQSAKAAQAKAKVLREKGADVVVGITRLSRQQTSIVAQSLDSVDVVILAAVEDETPVAAQKIEPKGPIMVSASRQGQYLGVISFYQKKKQEKWIFDDREEQRAARVALLSERRVVLQSQLESARDDERRAFLQKRLVSVTEELEEIERTKNTSTLSGNVFVAKTTRLSREILPDTDFDQRLKAYEAQIPKLVAQCEANIECPNVEPNQSAFVGAQTCRGCHSAAYEFWKSAVQKIPSSTQKGEKVLVDAGHSKAWETLELKNKIQDRSCVGCHSTGFMQPGGYCKVSDVGNFANVQCESCHGAGSQHAKTGNKQFIKREVPESTCRGCHHVPHIPTTDSFVYAQKLEHILGKGHGELFLEKIRHSQAQSVSENGLKNK